MRAGAPARFAVSEFRGPAIAGAHAMADARTAVWSQRIVVVATGRGSYCVRTAGVDFWGGVGGLGGLSQMSDSNLPRRVWTQDSRAAQHLSAPQNHPKPPIRRMCTGSGYYTNTLSISVSWVPGSTPLSPFAGGQWPGSCAPRVPARHRLARNNGPMQLHSRRHLHVCGSCLQAELSPPHFGGWAAPSLEGSWKRRTAMAPPPRRWFGQSVVSVFR
jgi:hypothetical protein